MQLYGYLKMLVDFILLLSEGAGLRFDGIYQGAKAAAQEEGRQGRQLTPLQSNTDSSRTQMAV